VVQRFVQEAKAASRIGHASIVDVIDFGSLPDGSAYSVMEYIDGVTLNKVIRAGPMPAARALPIAGQIARALAAAHEKGIVHRDLKPANVFLFEKGGRHDLVKIVDFGIAKFAPVGNVDGPTRITRGGAVFGTPEYMAPEQAAGRSDNDQRVDIYALGTVMYEMLVGRGPPKGATGAAQGGDGRGHAGAADARPHRAAAPDEPARPGDRRARGRDHDRPRQGPRQALPDDGRSVGGARGGGDGDGPRARAIRRAGAAAPAPPGPSAGG